MRTVLGLILAFCLAACSNTSPTPKLTSTPTEKTVSKPKPEPSKPTVAKVRTTTPPPWLGTRILTKNSYGYIAAKPTPPELINRAFTLPDTLPMLPGTGFQSKITTPAPATVLARSTWEPKCPVKSSDLAWVQLIFWGFDNQRHTGELLVNRSVAGDLVKVFEQLYRAKFPFEQMRIVTNAELTAPPTGDGNGTGSFVCRPITGGSSYSQHAYGLAMDLNTFQNPYQKGDVVLPELASAYLDRSRVRPGMILANGPVVAAFKAIGWGWGGDWNSLKDYQHFSQTGG